MGIDFGELFWAGMTVGFLLGVLLCTILANSC